MAMTASHQARRPTHLELTTRTFAALLGHPIGASPLTYWSQG